MRKTMAFLHTSPVHIATCNALLAELAPTIPVQHVVDESLLTDARAAGGVTPDVARRLDARIQSLSTSTCVVVCTCSTIGAYAEIAQVDPGTKVLRIDRAMAERAVWMGRHIVLAATLASTIEPTRNLLLSAARAAQKDVWIQELLIEQAWRQFESGNLEAYAQTIADRLLEAASEIDVIVLAQA